MKTYLIIDKNTMARENFCSIVYGTQNESIVYESESLKAAINDNAITHSIDFIIFNPLHENLAVESYLENLTSHYPDSKKILITQNANKDQIDSLFNHHVNAVMGVNASRSEVTRTIRAVIAGQTYISQTAWTSQCAASNNLMTSETPLLRNKFSKEISKKLTQRQSEVLNFIVKGCANKMIAYELGVSEGTIKLHVSSILRALKVTNRTEAAMQAGQFIQHQAH